MSAQARPRPRPERRPEGHLEVVRRRSRKLIRRGHSRRLAPAAILGSIFIVTLIFGVLLEQVVLAQSAFKVSDIRAELDSAHARHEELLLEAARLESPARIEGYAREQLGMTDPLVVEYIVADIPSRDRSRIATRPTTLPPLGEAAAQGATP